MPRRVNISPKAYQHLLRARTAKPTDIARPNGDYSIELTPKGERALTIISMYRKLNRRTASLAIHHLAHAQGFITTAEYQQVWGKGY